MHGWKRKSSFYIRSWYRRAEPNYFEGFGEGDRFWQPKYYSFEIYERTKLTEKLQYMHENPVRAGMVERRPIGDGVPRVGTSGGERSACRFTG